MAERYILIDAPGRHGTYATIYESHPTLDLAVSAAGHYHGGVVVVSDGGWQENHMPGGAIHQADLQRGYKILWALQIAKERATKAKERRKGEKWRGAYAAASAELADRYGGNGNGQYFAALDMWVAAHRYGTRGWDEIQAKRRGA